MKIRNGKKYRRGQKDHLKVCKSYNDDIERRPIYQSFQYFFYFEFYDHSEIFVALVYKTRLHLKMIHGHFTCSSTYRIFFQSDVINTSTR